MAAMTDTAARTAHLLALMRKGDEAFNARDFAAVDTVHHPQMVAHITGNAQPIYGSVKHGEAMQQMLRIFPDMHVQTRIRSNSAAATGSPSSHAPLGHSPERWFSPTAR